METKRILLTGKICSGQIQWNVAPPPQTDETQLVSRYMNSVTVLGTPTELWWDGWHACYEGHQLAEMPTEKQEEGWWACRLTRGEQESLFDGAIEDDYSDIRGGF